MQCRGSVCEVILMCMREEVMQCRGSVCEVILMCMRGVSCNTEGLCVRVGGHTYVYEGGHAMQGVCV